MVARRPLRRPGLLVRAIAVAALGLAVFCGAASAATVTNGNDSGSGSLRDAIAAASPGSTIVVPALTVTLTSGPLSISNDLTITGAGARATIISGNNNSGVFSITGGNVSISGVTITHGSVPSGSGGGVFVNNGASLTLADSTVTDNHVGAGREGGGIFTYGSLTVLRSTIAKNGALGDRAGGIEVQPQTPGETFALINSTVAQNTLGASGLGAGVYVNRGQAGVTFTNDTFEGNSAGGTGSALDLNNETAPTTITNTIVLGGGEKSCTRVPTPSPSAGHNLEDQNLCKFAQTGDQVNANPNLAALANNGGPTDTEALGPGSPAIDAGDDSGCPPTDQRGALRPTGPHCDIGAFEVASPTAVTGSATGVSATGATLNGFARNPDVVVGSVVFQYGTTTFYGFSTPAQPIAAATANFPVGAGAGGLAASTTYHFREVVSNSAGTSFGADRTFTTLPAPLVGAAQLLSASLTNKQFRDSPHAKGIQASAKRPRIGTTIRFSLDRAASIRLDFTQPGPGRKVKGKCVAQNKRNKGKRKCTRSVTRGTLSLAGHAGQNSVRFFGWVRGKKLKPGKYTLVITATTPGAGSSSKKLKFTIVK